MDRFDIISEELLNGCGCEMSHNYNDLNCCGEETLNAGGYGLFCNKKCAARKDEERAAAQAIKETAAKSEDKLIETVQQYLSTPDSNRLSTGAQIAIGLTGALVLAMGAVYIINKMRNRSAMPAPIVLPA